MTEILPIEERLILLEEELKKESFEDFLKTLPKEDPNDSVYFLSEDGKPEKNKRYLILNKKDKEQEND